MKPFSPPVGSIAFPAEATRSYVLSAKEEVEEGAGDEEEAEEEYV